MKLFSVNMRFNCSQMVFAGNHMVQDLRQLEKEIVLFPIMIVLSLNQTGRHILNNTNDLD